MLVRKGAKSERREASTSVFIGVWGLLGSGREGKFSQKLSTGFSLYDVSVGIVRTFPLPYLLWWLGRDNDGTGCVQPDLNCVPAWWQTGV